METSQHCTTSLSILMLFVKDETFSKTILFNYPHIKKILKETLQHKAHQTINEKFINQTFFKVKTDKGELKQIQ